MIIFSATLISYDSLPPRLDYSIIWASTIPWNILSSMLPSNRSVSSSFSWIFFLMHPGATWDSLKHRSSCGLKLLIYIERKKPSGHALFGEPGNKHGRFLVCCAKRLRSGTANISTCEQQSRTSWLIVIETWADAKDASIGLNFRSKGMHRHLHASLNSWTLDAAWIIMN